MAFCDAAFGIRSIEKGGRHAVIMGIATPCSGSSRGLIRRRNGGRASDDLLDVAGSLEIKAMNDGEPGAQR